MPRVCLVFPAQKGHARQCSERKNSVQQFHQSRPAAGSEVRSDKKLYFVGKVTQLTK